MLHLLRQPKTTTSFLNPLQHSSIFSFLFVWQRTLWAVILLLRLPPPLVQDYCILPTWCMCSPRHDELYNKLFSLSLMEFQTLHTSQAHCISNPRRIFGFSSDTSTGGKPRHQLRSWQLVVEWKGRPEWAGWKRLCKLLGTIFLKAHSQVVSGSMVYPPRKAQSIQHEGEQ